MPSLPEDFRPETTAEAILVRLKEHGIDYLFANAGTDFAPIIEIYAKNNDTDLPIPTPLIAPHENAAIAMAHGFYLATGKPQAIMVHVNVGLANAVMGIINAASDNIPIFVMAGRTPSTEGHRLGARSLPIHWGQDMRDQSAMVREFVKWDYELKMPDQALDLVDRGYAISMSAPRGPIYLGLPRETLGMDWPEDLDYTPTRHAPSSPPAPDPETVKDVAMRIAKAERPVIIAQRGDPDGRLGEALAKFAESFAVPVAEFWSSANVLATDHPMHAGFDPSELLQKADLILALDALVPWIGSILEVNPDVDVVQIGPDPLFSRVPIRGFKADVNLTAVPADAINALLQALSDLPPNSHSNLEERRANLIQGNNNRRDQLREKAEEGIGSPMSAAFVSRALSDVLPDDAVVFSELGCEPGYMDFAGPNHYHSHALAGGLGWGMPAALGACLADPDKITVACVGDGSYMFANPVTCHQIAEANELPLLTIVFNNGVWNAVRKTTLMMYPDGHASRMNNVPMSQLNPNPDFTMIAAASRGWSKCVQDGRDLKAALEQALDVIKTERRQALIEVMVKP